MIYIGSSCADIIGGGWWYDRCTYACLTADYGSKYYYWHALKDVKAINTDYSLVASRMMIKLWQ